MTHHKAPIKTLLIASLGAGIEYYDFAIFALFAPILAQVFFPNTHGIYGILFVFMIYALSYFIRPIGGYFFGAISDHESRKKAFTLTMLTLAISSALIAILPTTSHIGVIATILFVLLRLAQGLAIGGEIPTAITYVIEQFPKRQGLATSVIFACLSIGIFLTSAVFYLSKHFLDADQMLNYGWRIAFLIGAILTLLLYLSRRHLVELKLDLMTETQVSGNPIRNTLIGIAMIAVVAMLTTQMFIYLPTLTQTFLPTLSADIPKIILIGSMVMIPSCLAAGWLSDHLDRRTMFVVIVVLISFMAPFLYQRIYANNHILATFIMLSILLAALAPTYSVIIANLFKPSQRSRGLGLAYNLSYSLFSAPIPLITTMMVMHYRVIYIPALLITICVCISLTAIVVMKIDEKKQRMLRQA